MNRRFRSRPLLATLNLSLLSVLWLWGVTHPAALQSPAEQQTVFLLAQESAQIGESIRYEVTLDTDRSEINDAVLTLSIPSAFRIDRLRSGYFQSRATLEIEYTTNLESTWRSAGFWLNIEREAPEDLFISDLNLQSGEQVTQIRLVFDPLENGVQTGPGPRGPLAVEGIWLSRDLQGNALAAGDRRSMCVSWIGGQNSDSCADIELSSQSDQSADLALWITPIGPEPIVIEPQTTQTFEIGGAIIPFNLDQFDSEAALWFGVLLPAEWEYEPNTYRLGSDDYPAATTVFAEPLATGETILRVGWDQEPNLLYEALSSDPETRFTFAFDATAGAQLNSESPPLEAFLLIEAPEFECWGNDPQAFDRLDIDQDENTAERLCRITAEMNVSPQPDIQVTQRFSVTEANTLIETIRIVNSGNQALHQIKVERPVPGQLSPVSSPQPLSMLRSVANGLMMWEIESLEIGEELILLSEWGGTVASTAWGDIAVSSADVQVTIESAIGPAISAPLPDPTFEIPTLDYSDGPAEYPAAEHPIDPDLSLGLIVDADPAPLSTKFGTGDDGDHIDDEDGILFRNDSVGITGDDNNLVTAIVLNRTDQPVRLYGWIDFNQDNRFGDNERIIFGHQFGPRINPQAEQFRFQIPFDAACGPTIARFRLSPDSTLPSGPAGPGEVEDLTYTIQCTANLALTSEPSANPIGRDETEHWLISVTNLGPSLAERVVVTQTIPADTGYLNHEFAPNSDITCNEGSNIIQSGTFVCEIPSLAAGETITVDLAAVVPLIYPSETLTTTAQVSTLTVERDLSQNFVNETIPIEKAWILGDYVPTVDFAFTHVQYDPRLIINEQFTEQDFRLDTSIPTVIQTPISIAFGFNANTTPFLTVSSCAAHPDDPTCNSNNIVTGQVLMESFTLTGIQSLETGEMIYQPEEPTIVFINRVADSNLSRCAGTGSCVGYDLFRVSRLNIFPYAWQSDDYFTIIPITKGGRLPECEVEDRCILIQDALPGRYELTGEIQLQLFFDDRRIGDQPRINRLAPYEFTAELQVVAPFLEPGE